MLRKLNEIVKHTGRWNLPKYCDAEYAKYCIKSLFVQKQIEYKEDNFPRILDSYLQGKARNSAEPNEDTED